jgi:hypothetical protein
MVLVVSVIVSKLLVFNFSADNLRNSSEECNDVVLVVKFIAGLVQVFQMSRGFEISWDNLSRHVTNRKFVDVLA